MTFNINHSSRTTKQNVRLGVNTLILLDRFSMGNQSAIHKIGIKF